MQIFGFFLVGTGFSLYFCGEKRQGPQRQKPLDGMAEKHLPAMTVGVRALAGPGNVFQNNRPESLLLLPE